MSSSSTPVLPSPAEVSLPGRNLFRTGLQAQIAGAALRLGEGVLTTDNWWGHLGDNSQNPPAWPTSKTVGDFDWTNLNPYFNNINLNKINNKTLSQLFGDYITTGETPVITIINENLTKTVYSPNADFADLEAAYAWLSQRTISSTASVTLVFPVGKITETKTYTINHPNGERIFWKGAPLKTPVPPVTSFQVSGNTPAAQANDQVANLNLIRASFSTEIYFTNGGHITFTGDLGSISNILFSSDGAIGSNSAVDGIVISGASVFFDNVATVGFDYRGVVLQNGSLNLVRNTTYMTFGNGIGMAVAINSLFGITSASVVAIGNGGRHANDYSGAGMTITDNALVAAYQYYNDPTPTVILASGNTAFGIYAAAKAGLSGQMAVTARLNGNTGLAVSSASSVNLNLAGTFSDNGQAGITANLFSSIVATAGLTVTNNPTGIAAYNGSFVFRTNANVSGNTTNYSPALFQLGNTNALIA